MTRAGDVYTAKLANDFQGNRKAAIIWQSSVKPLLKYPSASCLQNFQCPISIRDPAVHIPTPTHQGHLQVTLPVFLSPDTTVYLHQQDCDHYPVDSTPVLTSPPSQAGVDMCWLTLSPTRGKKRQYDHRSSDSSCVEELVRVHRSPSRHRFTEVKVKMPSSISMEMSENHHHHHHPHLHPHLHHHHRHHLHPLHLHPLHGHHLHHHHHDRTVDRLHGHGRRRRSPPPSPPPPTRDPSRCRPRSPSPAPHRPREPIYRTQIVEPREVRETTRVALRTTESERQRGRLRRVAGYEVLGTQVPFDWDCISSTAGGSIPGGRWVRKKVKSSNLRFPPFGSVEQWK